MFVHLQTNNKTGVCVFILAAEIKKTFCCQSNIEINTFR